MEPIIIKGKEQPLTFPATLGAPAAGTVVAMDLSLALHFGQMARQ